MVEQYKAWCPEMGESEDDCQLFTAYDEEDAATDYARQAYDEGHSMTVYVRCTRSDSEILAFSVHAELEVYFHAYKLNLPNLNQPNN